MLGKLLKKAKAERFPTGLGQQDQAEEQQFGALYLLGRCSSLALGIGQPTNVEKEKQQIEREVGSMAKLNPDWLLEWDLVLSTFLAFAEPWRR